MLTNSLGYFLQLFIFCIKYSYFLCVLTPEMVPAVLGLEQARTAEQE